MTNRIVVVTGATGGLGPAVVDAFRSSGDTVVTIARKGADFAADLTNAEESEQTLASIEQKHGHVDVLVHVMGGFAADGDIEKTAASTWEQMLRMNLLSAVYVFRAIIPIMKERKQGRIIAVGSRAGRQPSPGLSAYGVSKAALHALVETAAAELRDHGVTANAVLPGTIRTATNEKFGSADQSALWVEPSSIAKLIHDLAGDGASDVSGALIPVYGRS